MKKISLFISLIFIMNVYVNAQSIDPYVLNANGGFTTIAGNTYEWSIGEMVLVNTADMGSLIVTQGLLQPAKASGGSSVSESQFIFDHVKVFPNPADNIFYLEADFKKVGEIHTVLYDVTGKIIDDKKIKANSQLVKIPYDVSALSAGSYMLVVEFSHNKEISKAAYKIEKTN